MMLMENVVIINPITMDMDMSNYPLTPPSSSEDSPQSMFYNSPASSYSDPYEPPAPGKAYLSIVEQPIEKFRFRYKSEMTGTHGSLCGQNSDRVRKQSYPTVALNNYTGKAVVRCSIYQCNAREDHKPHAHRLVRKLGSRNEVDDPHDVLVSLEQGYMATFHSMGIIHTAKKFLVGELVKKKTQLKKEEVARLEKKVRELTVKEQVEIKGCAEVESKSINLNVICLRFDAFRQTPDGILYPVCSPVYTHSINNLKSALTGELKIVRMDHCTSPANGSKEIFILVERVTKKNIKVRFFEYDDEDNLCWEDYGKFSDLDVHHQFAIVFRTPPYRDRNIQSPVKVYIELERPSDNARSEPKEFTYTVSNKLNRPGAKRARTSNMFDSSYETYLSSEDVPEQTQFLIPDTLNNIDCEVDSLELVNAMNNIDSDEFKQVFGEFGLEYQSITTDAPNHTVENQMETGKNYRLGPLDHRHYGRNKGPEESVLAKEVVQKLTGFLRSKPGNEAIIKMLQTQLTLENKNNTIHVLIMENDEKALLFLLKMIYTWQQNHLLSQKNEYGQTPLHLATALRLEDIVSQLITCGADITECDSDLNTCLHVAVTCNAPNSIFQNLFRINSNSSFIDAENIDGDTALNMAIDGNNLQAIKLLIKNKVNINKKHKKSGFTPLRVAIEKPNLEALNLILDHADLDPLIDDFQGINPLHAALKKTDPKIISTIQEFMTRNGYSDIQIKKEIEEDEEVEEFEEKYSVKLEQMSLDELRDKFKDVKSFTDECLDEVSDILDKSGTWQNLAELLDLVHLIRGNLCSSEQGSSPTKLLLKVAIETNGDSVLQIRDFLDNLDEVGAVECIDNMLKKSF